MTTQLRDDQQIYTTSTEGVEQEGNVETMDQRELEEYRLINSINRIGKKGRMILDYKMFSNKNTNSFVN